MGKKNVVGGQDMSLQEASHVNFFLCWDLFIFRPITLVVIHIGPS